MFYVEVVCLFFCLLATSHINYSSDLPENFTTDVPMDKKVLIKFW